MAEKSKVSWGRFVHQGKSGAKLRPRGVGDAHTVEILQPPKLKQGHFRIDVGSSHPGAEFGPKGLAVRQLKRHASWVQNVVRQLQYHQLYGGVR